MADKWDQFVDPGSKWDKYAESAPSIESRRIEPRNNPGGVEDFRAAHPWVAKGLEAMANNPLILPDALELPGSGSSLAGSAAGAVRKFREDREIAQEIRALKIRRAAKEALDGPKAEPVAKASKPTRPPAQYQSPYMKSLAEGPKPKPKVPAPPLRSGRVDIEAAPKPKAAPPPLRFSRVEPEAPVPRKAAPPPLRFSRTDLGPEEVKEAAQAALPGPKASTPAPELPEAWKPENIKEAPKTGLKGDLKHSQNSRAMALNLARAFKEHGLSKADLDVLSPSDLKALATRLGHRGAPSPETMKLIGTFLKHGE